MPPRESILRDSRRHGRMVAPRHRDYERGSQQSWSPSTSAYTECRRSAIEASVAAAEKPAPSRQAIPVLPLMALVVGLAAAAAWFVGIPQLTKPAPVYRGCEVIVLQSGKTKVRREPAGTIRQRRHRLNPEANVRRTSVCEGNLGRGPHPQDVAGRAREHSARH